MLLGPRECILDNLIHTSVLIMALGCVKTCVSAKVEVTLNKSTGVRLYTHSSNIFDDLNYVELNKF